MDMNDILELERKASESRLKNDLFESRMKSKQDVINAGIGVVVSNMNRSTLGLMYGAFNEEK